MSEVSDTQQRRPKVTIFGRFGFRYELAGTPLPYQADAVYETLFLRSAGEKSKRLYSTSSIPPCSFCQKPRIFECQLMPALIHSLRLEVEIASSVEKDSERLERLARLLKPSPDSDADIAEESPADFEWGTCMVFSCSEDCGSAGSDAERVGCWKEEFILVQWE
jgi:pre-rRNA-processing protein TSR4